MATGEDYNTSGIDTRKIVKFLWKKFNGTINSVPDDSIALEVKNFDNTILLDGIINKFIPRTINVIEGTNYVFNLKDVYDNTVKNNYMINGQTIIDSFRKTTLNIEDLKIQNDIQSNNRCSIHVRRGDYTSKINSKIHGLLNINYYQMAIDYLKQNGINKFIVFSDDIEWCKKNLKFTESDIIFSDFGFNQIQDLMLMSKCNSNIIANSSFSWWGAWLNQNPKKIIIAPKKWLLSDPNVDVIPNNWKKI